MIYDTHQLTRQQLELKSYLSYPKIMLKYFSEFFACLLLVLIPLQSIAAPNMVVCNSMMQAQSSEQSNPQRAQVKPCHMHMAGMSKSMASPSEKHQSPCCKTTCATLCASLNAMTALPSSIKPATLLVSTALINILYQAYASITQPNLQRPPIFLA